MNITTINNIISNKHNTLIAKVQINIFRKDNSGQIVLMASRFMLAN